MSMSMSMPLLPTFWGMSTLFGDYFKGHTHPYTCHVDTAARNTFYVARMMLLGVKLQY